MCSKPSNWCVRFNPCKMEQELKKFILKRNLINYIKLKWIQFNYNIKVHLIILFLKWFYAIKI